MKQHALRDSIYRVQALERALDILDCFDFQNKELTLSDLVRRTGLNMTTAKRLTANLTGRGYLQFDARTKIYQLGIRLFELGGIVFSSFSLRRAAAHPMTDLQSEAGTCVLLAIRQDNRLVYIDKREGVGMIRISSDIGWSRPLHYGMLGMVLMANLDPENVKQILSEEPLQPYTPFSITDEETFTARLEQIRDQGYVVEKEETVEGIIGIAAPIRDYTRRVVAALGTALPLGQRDLNKDVDRIVALVKQTCATISTDLGYSKM
ncbi:MAG: IclR family transcriptional regulator [Deltaproteobacteria bacterium]|nr:IclR family transcriptional regulator [Deltaproteobacteria bacterium]